MRTGHGCGQYDGAKHAAESVALSYLFFPMIDDLFSSDRGIREVRPRIHSLTSADLDGSPYDSRAAAYDRVVGSWVYNRLVWGVSTTRYRRFVRRSLAAGEGPLLDAGAGSAVFTADAYARTSRPLILVDRSVGMLEAARSRIAECAGGALPESVVLLQADAADLPLRRESIHTVLSMGLFHLVDDVASCVDALVRVLAPGGQLFATSLVPDRAFGRAYLRLLKKAGEIAALRSVDAYRTCLEERFDGPVSTEREGNMAFLKAEKG